MAPPLTLADWRATLATHGHRIEGPDDGLTWFRISPDVDEIVTVAVATDLTRRRPYRQRYFLCNCEGPVQILRAMRCPKPAADRWLSRLPLTSAGDTRDFLSGPGAWLLSRLARFPQMVAWASSERAAATLGATAGFPAGIPHVFDTADERFPDAVSIWLRQASRSWLDCCLASGDGSEVYLAHPHDKIVVSLPDVDAWEALLAELDGAPHLFADASGYGEDGGE
jgi:hypothetical protein